MNSVYRELMAHFGVENVFILSAGWGLVPADFLLPYYDITFSPQAEAYKRRCEGDAFHDFRMLPEGCTDDLVFFGGRSYAPPFARLARGYAGRKFVFHASRRQEPLPGCIMVPYSTRAGTNWQYRCARDFMAGRLIV